MEIALIYTVHDDTCQNGKFVPCTSVSDTLGVGVIPLYGLPRISVEVEVSKELYKTKLNSPEKQKYQQTNKNKKTKGKLHDDISELNNQKGSIKWPFTVSKIAMFFLHNSTPTVGTSVVSGKLLPGKCVGNVTIFPGNLHFSKPCPHHVKMFNKLIMHMIFACGYKQPSFHIPRNILLIYKLTG